MKNDKDRNQEKMGSLVIGLNVLTKVVDSDIAVVIRNTQGLIL